MIRVNKQNKLTSNNIDLEKTFGKLKFIGSDGQQMETENGEYTGEVKARRYGLKCEAQDDILTVFLPKDREIDLPMMTEVKLENIRITPFTGVNDNNRPIVNYKIEAENIVPVNATSKPVEPDKTKPQK